MHTKSVRKERREENIRPKEKEVLEVRGMVKAIC
jgi:hypothetical protein